MYDALSWGCEILIGLGLVGITAMVVAYYLRCPHCGSLRGSRPVDEPRPTAPAVDLTDVR